MADIEAQVELVIRARNGDRVAYQQLCEQYAARVWKIANAIAASSDAEDIAQEAIIRGWCSLNTCANPMAFEAWLMRITVNAGRDYLRSAWKRRVVSLVTGMPERALPDIGVGEQAQRRAEAMQVRRAVMKLPQAQAVPIWLHYFEGMSLKEISITESTAESTIRSRIKAGMAKLSVSLKDLEETEEQRTLTSSKARSNEA